MAFKKKKKKNFRNPFGPLQVLLSNDLMSGFPFVHLCLAHMQEDAKPKHMHEQMDGMKHISHCSTDLQVVVTCQEKWHCIINAVKRADVCRSPNL